MPKVLSFPAVGWGIGGVPEELTTVCVVLCSHRVTTI